MEQKSLSRDWPIWGLLALDLAAALYVYPYLPDKVPIHWNAAGQSDGWGSAFAGSFLLPFTAVGVYLLLTFLPLIDPRRANYDNFLNTYRFIKISIILFFVAVHLVTLASVFGWPVPVNQVVVVLVSVLFIMLGSIMGRIKQTYLVGIKTPWTLMDEGVWDRTHRFGGRVWMAAGALGMFGGILGGTVGYVIFFAVLAAVILLPVVYSYLDFRKTHN